MLEYSKTDVMMDSADLKNKHICPDGSYGLFLNLRNKKFESVIHIIIGSYNRYTQRPFLFLIA
jgi:hypothetical protein